MADVGPVYLKARPTHQLDGPTMGKIRQLGTVKRTTSKRSFSSPMAHGGYWHYGLFLGFWVCFLVSLAPGSVWCHEVFSSMSEENAPSGLADLAGSSTLLIENIECPGHFRSDMERWGLGPPRFQVGRTCVTWVLGLVAMLVVSEFRLFRAKPISGG